MRIFKETELQSDIHAIACEMLNIESSVYMWNRGKLEPIHSHIKGYPQLGLKNQQFDIKASNGIIWFPAGAGLSIDAFETSLSKEIIQMEAEHYANETNDTHLNKFHSVISSTHTNLKYKSRHKHTYTTSGLESKEKARRLIVKNHDFPDEESGFGARFTWYINPISEFMFKTQDPNYLIVSRMCSIFYDANDITIHPDNAFTVDFNISDIKHGKNVVGASIVVSTCGIPAIYEIKVRSDISRYVRSNKYTDEHAMYEELDEAVFDVPYKHLNLSSKTVGCCSNPDCNMPLFGDIYAYTGNTRVKKGYSLIKEFINKSTKKKATSRKHRGTTESKLIEATPYCPLCIHYRVKAAKQNDEVREILLRTTYPKTIVDVINESSNIPEAKKRALEAISTNPIKYAIYVDDGVEINTIVFGDYMAVSNINKYLFTNLYRVAADKKIVTYQFLSDYVYKGISV